MVLVFFHKFVCIFYPKMVGTFRRTLVGICSNTSVVPFYFISRYPNPAFEKWLHHIEIVDTKLVVVSTSDKIA